MGTLPRGRPLDRVLLRERAERANACTEFNAKEAQPGPPTRIRDPMKKTLLLVALASALAFGLHARAQEDDQPDGKFPPSCPGGCLLPVAKLHLKTRH